MSHSCVSQSEFQECARIVASQSGLLDLRALYRRMLPEVHRAKLPRKTATRLLEEVLRQMAGQNDISESAQKEQQKQQQKDESLFRKKQKTPSDGSAEEEIPLAVKDNQSLATVTINNKTTLQTPIIDISVKALPANDSELATMDNFSSGARTPV